MIPTTDRLLWGALHQAGRGRKPAARWTHIMTTFAVGSTTAHEICERWKMDPDEIIGDIEDTNEENEND